MSKKKIYPVQTRELKALLPMVQTTPVQFAFLPAVRMGGEDVHLLFLQKSGRIDAGKIAAMVKTFLGNPKLFRPPLAAPPLNGPYYIGSVRRNEAKTLLFETRKDLSKGTLEARKAREQLVKLTQESRLSIGRFVLSVGVPTAEEIRRAEEAPAIQFDDPEDEENESDELERVEDPAEEPAAPLVKLPADFVARLSAVVQSLKESTTVTAAQRAALVDLVKKANAAKDAAPQLAVDLLEEAEAGVKSLQRAAQATSARPSASGANAILFTTRLSALQPRLKAHLRQPGPKTPEIQALVAEASALAREQRFEEGLEVIDRMVVWLEQARPPFDEEAFRSAWTVARKGWEKAIDEVDAQIVTLKETLLASSDDELQEIARTSLDGLTARVRQRMGAAIGEIEAAKVEALPAVGRRTLATITNLETYLDTDPRVAATDENEFGVSVKIRPNLGEALQALKSPLGSLA